MFGQTLVITLLSYSYFKPHTKCYESPTTPSTYLLDPEHSFENTAAEIWFCFLDSLKLKF